MGKALCGHLARTRSQGHRPSRMASNKAQEVPGKQAKSMGVKRAADRDGYRQPMPRGATQIDKERKKTIFYGWWVVAALFLVGMLGPMGRYSLSALAPFLQMDFPWTKSQISMAFSIQLWSYSLLVLAVGWAIDRFGSRRIIFLGGFILLVALILVSQLSTLWQLYLFFGVFTALGVSMTHFVPTQTVAMRWFTKKAGLVGGIVTAAFGAGLAILSPLLTWMAGSIGWRNSWLISALAFGVIIMLLASLVIRNTPESVGLYPDGKAKAGGKTETDSPVPEEVVWSPKEAMRTSPFWFLFIANGVSVLPAQGMLTQVVMWGVDLGEPLATAGMFMTAFALPSVVGKVMGGWLGDRYGKKKIMGIAFFASLLIMISAWLTVDSRSSLLIIAILFGVAYGLPVGLFPAYLAHLYGRASLGTLLGIQVFGATLLGGAGPFIWGSVADITGSYNVACLISAMFYAVAVILLILINPGKLAKSYKVSLSSAPTW